MTTRPTDEEIRAVSERLNRHINTGSYDLDVMQLAADYLNAWIAERQQDKTESGLVRCFEALGVQPADPGHKWSFLVTEIKRLVERQAARVGITDEMVEKFKAEQSNGMSRYTSAENAMGRTPRMQDAMDYGTRAAIQSIAQPVSVPDGLSPVALAVIGRKHFGNPIPKEWYAAAKELLSTAPAYNGKKDEQ